MHEHGLARRILAGLARDLPPPLLERGVRLLRLRVREDAGLDAGFLLHGLEEEAEGTPFAGARIEVTMRPVEFVCPRCGCRADIASFRDRCPDCGSVEVRSDGETIEVEEIVWEDE